MTTPTSDLIITALTPTYGPDNVGAMLRKYYLAEFGTTAPTQAQLRTLFAQPAGTPFTDALRAHFAGDLGAQFFNFAPLINGNSLPPPWVDAHSLGVLPQDAWTYADEHDKLGIRSGGIALIEYTDTPEGKVALTGMDVPGSGLRGTAYISTIHTDDYYVKITWPGVHGRNGIVACAMDSTDPLFGIGFFFDYAFPLYTAFELFYIGAESGDFAWLDFTADTHVDGTPVVLELRVKDNVVAGYADGVLRCGPITLPAELQGNSKQGVHIDLIDTTPVNQPCITNFEVGAFAGVITDYATPIIQGVPTTAEATTLNTIDVAYPADIVAGELLIAIVGSGRPGTLSSPDWTAGNVGSIAGNVQLGFLRKTATGLEAGNFTITKTGTANNMGVVCFRVSGQNTDTVNAPISANYTANSVASVNLTAPSKNVLGKHRLGLWAGVVNSNNTITKPADWTDVASTGVIGTTINVLVARRDWDSIQPPYGRAGGTATGTQVGTIGASVASIGGHFLFDPEPV